LGRNDEAVEALHHAVGIRPDFALAYHNLGSVYIRQQKYKPAIAALERAAALQPDFAETLVQWGYALSALKNYDEAVKRIEQAVQLNPNDSEAQFFLGQLYLANRDKQSALAQYRKIALLDSQLAKTLYSEIYANMLVEVREK